MGREEGISLKQVAQASGSISKAPWQENRLVTRKHIVQALAEELGIPQLQIKQLVQNTLDAIVNTLVEEGRVELRNFGEFEVRWQGPRQAHNPRTGEQVMVPERCTVKFKPGLMLEEKVIAASRTAAAGRKSRLKGPKAKASLDVGAARAGE